MWNPEMLVLVPKDYSTLLVEWYYDNISLINVFTAYLMYVLFSDTLNKLKWNGTTFVLIIDSKYLKLSVPVKVIELKLLYFIFFSL